MAKVVLDSLTKVFSENVTAVDALDLTIEDGEFFALLGPSGCGKTTLLRMIAGLETPTEGAIFIGDRDVTHLAPGRRDVAMVFQDYALYPHMTVLDNIAYPLKVRKIDRDKRHDTAAEAGKSLQLGELLDRRPAQLSGGQQQRAAVARAVAYHPAVFLFDEPLSNLDARLRLEARTFLKRLQKELGVTTVYVTHDQSEALALADRIAVMRQGRICQLAPPREIYHRPNSLFVASFIGSVPMNLLPATVEDGALCLGPLRLELPSASQRDLTRQVVAGVRPEYGTLTRSEAPQALRGAVSVVELLGDDYLVTVESESLTVQVTSQEAVRRGDTVWVSFAPERILLYSRDDEDLLTSVAPATSDSVTVSGAPS